MGARTWPFVGRGELIESVSAALDDGRAVVLSGPAGLGKTRAAIEIAARLTASGVGTTRVVASPATSPVPLAPFAHLIGGETGAAAVNAVLAAIGADRRRGAADPVLVVDDLHLLDDASATVVHQITTSGKARLLATRRAGAAVPTSVERLLLEPNVSTIDVEPMSDESICRMAEDALGGPLDRRSREMLASMAAGNPLFAHEIVEGSIAGGRLTRLGGVWQLDGDPAATPLLEEVVLARLAPLPPAEREAVELLTVGGALDFAVLDRIVGSAALEQLERSELITAVALPDGQVSIDVAHPLYRELVRARLGAIARMRLSRTLALAVGAPDASRPITENLRSVVWHVRGGLDVEPEQLVAAGHHLLNAGDPALGAELAEHAFVQTRGTRAAMLASWCLAQTGDHERAIDVIREARDATTDGWERAAMRLRVAEELWWTGRAAAGMAELDAGAQDPSGPWNDLLEAQRGVFAMLDGDVDVARRHCEALLDHDHLWVRFASAVAMGNVGLLADEPDRAIEVCARAHAEAVADDVELVGGVGIHLAIQLNALVHAGQLELAHALAIGAHADAAQQPSIQVRAWAATLLARSSSFVGDLRATSRAAAEAERLWVRNGHVGVAAWCAAGLAQAQVQLGATDEANETLGRLDGYDRTGFGQYEATVPVARAWLAHAAGDRATAAAELRDAATIAATRGQTTVLSWVWHDAARMDLLPLLPEHETWHRPAQEFSAVRWDFVRARAAGDGAALTDVGERFEALGARLFAAEAFALASVALRRAGDAKTSARLDGRAGALAAELGGIVTPPLSSRTSVGLLSAREHEIASLAASGLSNRQIAQRLVVSERTIENHLYRTFIKLGVSSRDELAGAVPADSSRRGDQL